jgi:radical SAM superfamily enzyme YgiQ (UPF0313 family)
MPSILSFAEGELSLAELAKAIESGADPTKIAGLSFKQNGKIIDNADRPLIADLDSMPFPARHLFSNKQYKYPDTLHYPAYAIITSRGCPGRCTFCQSKNIYGNRPRFRSATSVVDEIELLINKFGARELQRIGTTISPRQERVSRSATR